MATIIPLLTLESRIKRQLRAHLRDLGFGRDGDGMLVAPGDSKSAIRGMHAAQRADRLTKEASFIERAWPPLRNHFADGDDIRPELVGPALEVVKSGTWQADLFRLAALTWSIPVSQGFGRRIRFLVWDSANHKLMGLIALGDPVFNLNARDTAIGWNAQDREKRLANLLDAYVLGAVPPYSLILAGKLLACLIRSAEVRDLFDHRYGKSRGLISGQRKHPRLAAVTTTSALGRSAVYNRLKLNSQTFFEPVGFTNGWGHFHVPDDLFALIRAYLVAKRDEYATNNRFGDGPNWKFRAIRRALGLLGLNRDLLRHTIKREVYLCRLATNACEFLRAEDRRLVFPKLPTVSEVGALARERWLIPRSMRRPEFRSWRRDGILHMLIASHDAATAFGLSRGAV